MSLEERHDETRGGETEACFQGCSPKLTGEPSKEQSGSLEKHPVLLLCQLGDICLTTIPNFKVR